MADPRNEDDDGPRLQDSGFEELDADDLNPGALGPPSLATAASSAPQRSNAPSGSPRTVAGTAPVSSFFPRSSNSSSSSAPSAPRASGGGSDPVSAVFFKPRAEPPSSSSVSLQPTAPSHSSGPSRSAVLSGLGSVKQSQSAPSSSASGSSSGKRQLPLNMLPPSSVSKSSASAKQPLHVLQPKHMRTNSLLQAGTADVSRFASGGGVPVVDGSNARTPSVLLNGSAALPDIPRVKPESKALIPSAASTSQSNGAASTSSSASRAKKEADVIDLTLSDDDEPKVVSVKKTEPDVVLDSVRNAPQDNQIVCIGMVRAQMTVIGTQIPLHMITDHPQGYNWFDPYYESVSWPSIDNMPRGSAFWTEPGYRPVHIDINHRPVRMVPTGDFVNGQWAQREEVSNIPMASVLPVLSPAHVVQQKVMRDPSSASSVRMSAPQVIHEPFGTLYDRPAVILANLQLGGQCGLEARFKVVPRVRAMNPFHHIEVNIFVSKMRMGEVLRSFRDGGIPFERPSAYDPSDYPGHPPLITEHLVGGFNSLPVPTVYRMPQGSGSSVSYTPVDNQEEARKQVDQVYSALRAGEDLPTSEAGKLLKTRLFPHQKQALSFLLDREKARSWEEDSEDEDSGKAGSSTQKEKKGKVGRPPKSKILVLSDDDDDDIVEVDAQLKNKGKDKDQGDDRGKGKGKEDKKEPRVVSLWKAEKNPYNGNVTSWTNVVTGQKQKHRPHICRGAILADDMGLGKTISIIALMTRTWDEAEDFGDTKVTTLDDVDLPEDEDDEDEVAEANSFGFGMPRGRKKKGKKEKKWREQERARITNLRKRSRATLIVCPLTVVSNWIEQINEHWTNRDKPKIYMYHGPSRQQSVPWLAKHDVIITTYSTLGYEFGRSTAWADEEEADAAVDDLLMSAASSSKKGKRLDESDTEDDDEDFEMFDMEGNKVGGGSKGKVGGKRKKVARKKEHYNPLQRIEFFRVVLDESHMIKETSTLQSKAVCNLSAQRRISLTGTPIQNKLDDLYAQFKFLRLDPFHKKTVWTRYCMHNSRISLRTRKESQSVDSIGLARIQTIMKAIALRRTKDSKDANGEPILKLPPKANRIVTLEFDEHERAKYEAMRHRYKEDFEQMVASDSVGKNYASILVEINALRLTCDDATLVDFGKDMKRAKQGRTDLIDAIREDGLSPDRAVQLFRIFVDCDQGSCYDCERDLSGKLEAEEEDTDEEAPKKRNKKAKTSKNALTESGELSVNPVVTRCQHLFCVDCFSNKLGTAWAHTKSDTKAPCPQCNESLTVIVDAIELDAEMIQEAKDSEKRRNDSDSETDSEDALDDLDLSDTESEDDDVPEDSRAWRPKTRMKRILKEANDDQDDEDEEGAKDDGGEEEDDEKPSRASRSSKEQKPKQSSMSSKVRALLEELEPFSRCNPYSQLYDREAPRLDHWAPPPPKKEVKNETAKSDTAKDSLVPSAATAGEGSSAAAGTEEPVFEPVKVISLPPLSELVGEEAAEARKAEPIKSVVFSQWTRMLDRIGKALDKKGIRYARLDGTMARTQRAKALEAFKHNKKVEVMLISLRAGGFGLNLVSACRAYLVDPYWNPAVENQGLDRIYRLGQRKPVVLTRFIMKKSIEENMLELQKRKMELAEQVGRRRGPQTAAERREERERDLRDLLR